MAMAPKSDPVPLRVDALGALRIGDTRVLLELVIQAFEDGATPEVIIQRYETLSLRDVYAVIAYYLGHRAEVEDYLRQRERQADEVKRRINAGQRDLGAIRRRLLSRRTTERPDDAPAGQ